MPPPPFWAKPRFVLTAIVIYLAVHFAVRMAMWPALGIDDAEQALFAQHLQWSYRSSAPPLFTWVLIGLGNVLGVNIVAISVIRYLLIGIIFVFTYLTARRLIDDPRLAALSVYSLASIYVIAFYSHHDLTHTTLMTAMLALAWYVFVRLYASPALGWYLALGTVCGLGLLGKWNFVMFALALPLACLTQPYARRLVLSWKSVPAIAIAAAVVVPTVIAVLGSDTLAHENVNSVLVGGADGYFARVAEGARRLVQAAIVYPQPFLVLLLIVLATPLWRGVISAPAGSAGSGPRPNVALIGWVMAIALGLHLTLVLAIGAREFSNRLMQPALFILPVFLFMLIARGHPSRRALNTFALMLLVLALGTLATRVALYMRGADHCSSCRAMVPFDRLGTALRDAGYDGGGTIIADGFHIGGNMRVVFPDARIVDPTYPPTGWPFASGDGPCLLLWQERDDPARGAAARDYLQSFAERDIEAAPPPLDGVVAAQMFGSDSRQYRLGFRLYDAPVGGCR